jgi:hypothetical protein
MNGRTIGPDRRQVKICRNIAETRQVVAGQWGPRRSRQWQHAVSAGNYDYHSLLQAQHEFVQQCENARKAMVF